MQFKSATAFANFLAGKIGQAERATVTALRDAGDMIQHEARDSLGSYHGPVGPIPSWPELSERTQREREERGLSPDDPLLATGELQEHIDVSTSARKLVVGVPHEEVGDGSHVNPVRDIGMVAIAMEQGEVTRRASVPPRPFLSRAAHVMAEHCAAEILHAVGDAVANVPHIRPHQIKDEIPF